MDISKMTIMNNPIDYLWYKLYKLQNSFAAKSVSSVLFANSLTIVILICNDIPNWSLLFLVLGLFLMFHYEKREIQARILKKYRCESRKSRIRGNIIVIVYVILSFVAPFIIIKIRNGFLLVD
jgi:hypothetical protein